MVMGIFCFNYICMYANKYLYLRYKEKDDL